ncbi:MAG: sigma-70 family RNA polymerase sigma factor [Flavobacteriales bacterium]|nr:sigma-70 family RNA polymerase sigma factor [Flavobacteriales bacterium]MCX7768054.1 sigma-70 family RNA polymerase sigma factor [Flavobacteriales bacterium]MDW8409259.1 sigma-70 family RNA polymerase sigma factor [Flavobacteriales bacterium]
MKVCKLSDQELVNAFLNGQSAAFEQLLNRHKNRVYSYIFMMVKDRELAEDIFQDTFIKVIHTLRGGRYNEEGKFLPWVLRIAHNLAIDHYRRRCKMPLVRGGGSSEEDFDIFSVLSSSLRSAEEKLIALQTDQRLHQLISHLPKEQKEVLMLRVYGGLSFQEIAQQTGVSINTALGRMRYALINLRKLIRQHRVELGD